MKNLVVLILCLSAFLYGHAQLLPVYFEADITDSDFIDFDGGAGSVEANPSVSGINTSDSVGRIIRNGGLVWAGSKFPLAAQLDFSTLGSLSMKVYTTAPVGTTVKFKLEGSGAPAEVDAFTTRSGEWETLTWDFTGTPANTVNMLVFMFDFGNLGDGSATSTFYFDDIEQVASPPAPAPTSLPIDFEGNVSTASFDNFDGGHGYVVANPQKDCDFNYSDSVGQIVRDGGALWAGAKIMLNNTLDFTTMRYLSMKVYTTAPIGTTVKFKLEGPGGATEIDELTTKSGEWETISWDFNGQASNAYDWLVFMFDFGNLGDSSINSTFLFDDIVQSADTPTLPAAPLPTTIPVDFETSIVSSDFINICGGTGLVISNPQVSGINTSNTVGQIIRNGGNIDAGSTLMLSDSLDFDTLDVISMKVFTDATIGTPVRLQLESSVGNFTADAMTTVSGEWEIIDFDFSGQAKDLYSLSFLFDYGNVGDGSITSTFLFDDVVQTMAVDTTTTGVINLKDLAGVKVYPNPTRDQWTITLQDELISTISLFDALGNKIAIYEPGTQKTVIDASGLASGLYFLQFTTPLGAVYRQLIKE